MYDDTEYARDVARLSRVVGEQLQSPKANSRAPGPSPWLSRRLVFTEPECHTLN